MSIHDVIDVLRSDPKGISEKFSIPIITVYAWCRGSRRPPDYVISMMLRIIELEGGMNNGKDSDRLGG